LFSFYKLHNTIRSVNRQDQAGYPEPGKMNHRGWKYQAGYPEYGKLNSRGWKDQTGCPEPGQMTHNPFLSGI